MHFSCGESTHFAALYIQLVHFFINTWVDRLVFGFIDSIDTVGGLYSKRVALNQNYFKGFSYYYLILFRTKLLLNPTYQWLWYTIVSICFISILSNRLRWLMIYVRQDFRFMIDGFYFGDGIFYRKFCCLAYIIASLLEMEPTRSSDLWRSLKN